MSIPYKMNKMGVGAGEPLPPDNEIWYWADTKVTLHKAQDVVSHEFADGKGVLTFASAVTNVKSWFMDTAVTKVYLPNSVTVINFNLCNNCASLEECRIPDGVTDILLQAFNACKKLKINKLPSSIVNLGQQAFYFCEKATFDTIPSGVKTIGLYAFAYCFGITSIKFLGTPTTINSYAFIYCTNIADIYVPWAEGEVAGAPWGATNATIHYNWTP